MEAQRFNGCIGRGTAAQGGIPPWASHVMRVFFLLLLAAIVTLTPPMISTQDGLLPGLALAGDGNDQGGNNQDGNDQGENDQGGGSGGPDDMGGPDSGSSSGGGMSEQWILDGAIPNGAIAGDTVPGPGPGFAATVLSEDEEAEAIAKGWPSPGQ